MNSAEATATTAGASQRRRALLAFGVVVGLVLALADVVVSLRLPTAGEAALPESIAASVDGVDIPASKLAAVLSDLSSDKREALQSQDQKFALQRLIDEQLLINRATELQLHLTVPEVRKSLASAMLAQIAAEASAESVSAEAVDAFYAANQAFFTQPERFQLRLLQWNDLQQGEAAKAENRRRQLTCPAGDVDVQNAAESRVMVDLPTAPMPASTWQSYIGAEAMAAVSPLSSGSCTPALYVNGYWSVVIVDQKIDQMQLPLEEIRPVVATEIARRKAASSLHEYLDWLKQRADVRVNTNDN